MTDPYERARKARGERFAPYGSVTVQGRSGSLVATLPKPVPEVEEGQEMERWYDPVSGAVILVPEGEDPSKLFD